MPGFTGRGDVLCVVGGVWGGGSCPPSEQGCVQNSFDPSAEPLFALIVSAFH